MFYDLKNIYTIYSLFDLLESCYGVKQMEEHHPEGDVFVHSVQCLNLAMKESNDIDLIFAAMLHDVGKKIDSKKHEKYGLQMVEGKVSNKTYWLIENHMRFWYFILGDMKKQSKVLELHSNEWFPDLALLCRWDKMGRNPNKKINYDRVVVIDKLKSRFLEGSINVE